MVFSNSLITNEYVFHWYLKSYNMVLHTFQSPCPKCGKIFLRKCHLICHVKPGVCHGSRMENDVNDEISPITYSAEHARRIDGRIKMNTPIVLDSETDVNLLKQKMVLSLNGPSLEQRPKRNPDSNENHIHLYNPPTIAQQTKDIFEE